jgi:hypothetical protein
MKKAVHVPIHLFMQCSVLFASANDDGMVYCVNPTLLMKFAVASQFHELS